MLRGLGSFAWVAGLVGLPPLNHSEIDEGGHVGVPAHSLSEPAALERVRA